MKHTHKIRERTLEQILYDENLISQDHLGSAKEEREATGDLLINIILKNDYVDERDLAKCLVENYQLPFLYPQDYRINKDVKAILPAPLLHRNVLYPLDVFGSILVLVTSGHITTDLIQEIRQATDKDVAFYLAPHSAVMKILKEEFPLDEIANQLNSRMDELFGGIS